MTINKHYKDKTGVADGGATLVSEGDTLELVKAKATALSESLGVKVHPMVFDNPETGKKAIGFLREPNRATKIAGLDEMLKGMTTAGKMILESCIIREESDPAIIEDDTFYVSACLFAVSLLKVIDNELKKK